MLGRRRVVDIAELEFYEALWIAVFKGLRDGSPEEVAPSRAGSAMLIKATSKERESLSVWSTGKRRFRRSVHKDLAEDVGWPDIVKGEEARFARYTSGEEQVARRYPAVPSERPLWEALKRASTPAQVRRTCARSKHWLKWEYEQEFTDESGKVVGSHPATSPILKALYDHAEEFCESKLDPRYPKADYSDDKRIEYLARVMAGLSLPKPVSPSYADKILRELKADKS